MILARRATILAAAALLAAAFGVSAHEEPAGTESIHSFHTEIRVNPDSSIAVKERIVYDFGAAERHGIFRDIPVKYETSYGNQMLRISDVSVTDGEDGIYQAEVSNEGRYKRIKIGDPDAYVTGVRTYVITYKAERSLGYFDDYDEIYWNATGNEWGVPIESATALVELPSSVATASLRSSCYIGRFGSAETCMVRGEQPAESVSSIAFESPRGLEPFEGLTVAVGFPKGAVSEPSSTERVLDLIRDNWILLLPLAVFAGMFRLWHSRGRDPKGRGTIVPEYDAPEDLSPLEVAAVMRQDVKGSDISAAVIYLATRGHLEIERKEEQIRFAPDKVTYVFKRTQSDAHLLSKIDEELIVAIFDGKESVTLADLKNKFYRKVPDIRKKVIASVIEKGYYASDPGKVTGKYILAAAAFFVAIWAFGMAGLLTGAVVFALVVSGFIVGCFAFIMPRATEKGVKAREAVLGLKEYLQIAEKDRLEFHNAPAKNPKLFEKLLPYAMVLGVEGAWAKEFADIYMEPPQWYHGPMGTRFNTVAFAGDMKAFNSAVMTNMASAPGSSSGSGGGGFSGGGGGGGGGGSW